MGSGVFCSTSFFGRKKGSGSKYRGILAVYSLPEFLNFKPFGKTTKVIIRSVVTLFGPSTQEVSIDMCMHPNGIEKELPYYEIDNCSRPQGPVQLFSIAELP